METQPTDNRTPLERSLDRLNLCIYAIQETHYEIEVPQDPDQKADLLLATESLTQEAIDLLMTIRSYVWGPDEDEEEELHD